MAKQLNVNMNFTADTSNVESNLNKLKQSLNQIASTPIKMGSVNEDLKQASVSARQLQLHLNNAFNQKTGNLDLSKLQTSLAKSNQSLSQLSVGLLGAGRDGQQAFLQMQTAIHNANIQIKKSTGFLAEMGTVLKNTIRWQLSSSMVHGFMSGVQQATGYVKDLNKSLTNIRIVTGQSTDDMAKFAEQANKSAKALSSTTTAYTNAALIYYQQGLDDKAVKERTDATIKMSNVTGQSAEEVSSYMTAIWNNFDDGSKSLEHYADVITALGASTASSSKEIAEGLEKFAAIGKTVGLSYDYATTALATVVAQTRQSADVVGTAFKTLFARIQDLELGKTLDDGTTLGKYSQALEAVGVNIKDSQGNLKNMNTILDEMGAKWTTLSKDQQVALAQNVAGVRQYTQLVALMDNWDKFQQNLGVAQNSEGALQEQADIYAESWEGASKRVKASMQGIYSDLINDKALIKGTNALADFVSGINKIIDAAGGLRTIIFALGTLFTKMFQNNIVNGINIATQKLTNFGIALGEIKRANETNIDKNLWSNLGNYKNTVKTAKNIDNRRIQDEAALGREKAIKMFEEKSEHDPEGQVFLSELKTQNEKFKIEKLMKDNSDKITESKRAELELELEILETYGKKVAEAAKLKKETQENYEILEDKISDTYNDNNFVDPNAEGRINLFGLGGDFSTKQAAEKAKSTYDKLMAGAIETSEVNGKKIRTEGNDEEKAERVQQLQELYNKIEQSKNSINKATQEGIELDEKEREVIQETYEQARKLGVIKKGTHTKYNTTEDLEDMSKQVDIVSAVEYNDKNAMRNKARSYIEKKDAKKSYQIANENFKKEADELSQSIKNLPKQVPDFSQQFTKMFQGASQASMGFSMLYQSIKIFADEEASFGEKITTALTSLTMGLPMLLSGLKAIIGSFKTIKDNILVVKQATAGVGSILKASGEVSELTKKVTELKIDKEITEEKGKQVALEGLKNELIAQGISEENASLLLNQISEKVNENMTAEDAKQLLLEQLKNKEKMFGLAISLKTVAIALAIVAAVAAIGYGIYKAATQEEAALEKAKEATKELKEAADESQQTYETLMNTISDYKDAKNGLNQLTKGTTEWSQQVTKLNGQVLELMDNYEGLAQYVTNQDGVLTISDAGLDYLADTQLKRTQSAQNQYAQAQINENKAENEVIYKKLRSELSQGEGSVSRDEAKEIIAAVQGNGELTKDIYEKYGITIDNANEKVATAAEAILANTVAIEALTEQMADNDLIGQDWYDSSEVKGYWQDQYNNYVDNMDPYKKVELFQQEYGIGDDGYQKAFKEYAEVNGIKDTSSFRKSASNANTSNYVYTDNEGNKKTISESTLLEYGIRETQKKSFKDSEEYEIAQTNLTKITDAITDSFSNVSDDIKNQMIVDVSNARHGKEIDFTKYSFDQIDEMAKISSRDDQLASLGNATREYLDSISDITDKVTVSQTATVYGIKADATAGAPYRDGTKYTTTTDTMEVTPYMEAQAKKMYQDAWDSGVKQLSEANSMTENEVLHIMASVEDPTQFLKSTENGLEPDMERLQAEFDKQKEIKISAEIESLAQSKATQANLDPEEIEIYAKQLHNMKEYANYSAEAITDLAIAQKRFENACVSVTKDIETWKKELKSATKETIISQNTYKGLQEAYGDLLNIDGSKLTDDFIRNIDNAELLEKAINGDTKAYDKLRELAAKDKEIKFGFANNEKIQGQIHDLKNMIENNLDNYEIGVNINEADFLEDINKLANDLYSLGMSATEVGDYMVDALGIEAEVTEEPGDKKETVVAHNLKPVPGATTEIVGQILGKDITTSVQGVSWEYTDVKAETETAPATGVKVKNAHKTAGGGVKKNMLGGKNTSGSSKGSGGSGGGGSKKSHSSSKERYHTIDKQIGNSKRAYEALEKAKSKAYGADKLKAMDAEIKKNDELIKQTRQRAAEVEKYRKEDKKALEDAAKNFGIKVQYDKNGNIANYDAIMDQADKKAKSGDEEVEEKYTKLTEAISQYEETLEEAATTQESLNELIEQNAQIELEKIEYKVDVKLELSERELRKLDYQIKQWERVNQNGFKDTTYVNNILGKMAENQNKYNTEENAIKEILKNRGANDKTIAKFLSGKLSDKELRALGLTDAELQSIKKHSDNMLGYAESISDAQDQIYSVFGENLEVYQSKYDEQINAIEHQKNIVSGLQEVFTLTGKGNAELLGQMRESVKEATLTGGLAAKQNMQNVKTEMDKLQKLRDDAEKDGNDALVASLDSQLNTYQEYYNEQEEAYISALQETIELIKENLAASLEDFSKEYQKGIAGAYGTFGALELAMEMDEETRNMVVAPYQKAYELSKLTRDIQKSVDETDNIKAKQTLLKLEEKINAAREEGIELTQYDLDRMRAEYDLEIAKIALEEAQNAKNTVRMQRDNNGNWSYVYTADTDKIADAQQKYEEAVNAMRKLDDERLYSVQQQVVQIYKELDERIKDILTNDSYSDEEKQLMIEEARATAKEQLTILSEEMQRVLDNQKDFYENEAENYHRFTNRNIEELGRWNTAFKDTLLGQANGYESGAEMVDSLEGSVNEYVNKAVEAFEKSKEAEKDAMEQLGVDATTANGAINELNTTLQTTVKTIEDLGTALANADIAALTKINDASGKYQVTIDGADETFGAITLNLKKLAGFDTGGYTGDWNSTNGKLALLHKKELVLNETQTRDLLETIKLLENYVLPTIKLAKFDNLNKKNTTLDQNVMIQAEFPNVTNHLEIEEAFNNLINTASQYANRK